MAKIGSPPAGWYTDPSGQHHARYWDGSAWTEDVRNDLVPGGVDAVSPANPAAETVASVAEAVAAVAANDVAGATTRTSPAPSPSTGPVTPMQPVPGDASFVVDYGTDIDWGAMAGTDGLTGPAGGMDSFPPQMPGPMADPNPSGPIPAWYPDPASRHEARFWDGTRWTDRVADFGQEGVDLLPGIAPTAAAISWTNTDLGGVPTTGEVPAFTAVTGAPVAGGWSDTLPTMTDDVRFGNNGQPMTAGQISLATLPAGNEADADSDRGSARSSVKVRVAGGFVLAGAIGLLFGSTATWVEVSGPRVGEHWSASGVDLGDGRITVVLGLVLALLGAVLVTGRLARFGGAKVAAMGALVAGAAATAVTAVDIADVADRATRLGVPIGAVSNVGTGLWIAFLGALFAVAGGLMAFANRS